MMNCKRLSSSSTTSAEAAIIIGGNEDLLLQILHLLPAKSLIRFRSVSKEWDSLISDSSFWKLYTLRHQHDNKHHHHPPTILLRSTTSPRHFFHCDPIIKKLIPYRFKIPFVKILQSCNGLVLLEGRTTIRGRRDYYVYNLTTTQSKKLLINDEKMKTIMGVSLIYDPSKSPHYSVFCMYPIATSECEVYDSETDTWKNGGREGLRLSYLYNPSYSNGYFYSTKSTRAFLIYKSAPFNNFFHETIEHPFISECRGARRKYLMESNGHLHYIVQSLNKANDNYYIWVFEIGDLQDDDPYSDWLLKYRVDLNPISAAFAGDNDGKPIRLIGIIRGDKEKDSMLLFHVPGKIIFYRFFDKSFEVLVDFTGEAYYKEGKLQFGSNDSYQFMETLVPV